MVKTKYAFLLLFIFSSLITNAQTDFSAKTWHYFDTAINKKNNLVDLLALVKNLGTKAKAEQKYFYVARCLNYELAITDLKTEDSLYFKNSLFIDEMLSQPAQPKQMQYALHLMQSARLIKFTKRYNKFSRSRYELKNVAVNYAGYENPLLDSIAQLHFEQAKNIAREITTENIDEALWLSSDPLQFLYKPGLFDIAIAEQVNTVKVKYFYETAFTKMFHTWMVLSPDAFIEKLDSVNVLPGKMYKDLRVYREWLNYQKSNSENYYFLETVIHKYLYELVKSRYPETEKIYESYLLQQSLSKYNTVKAYSVYQLCLLWNSQSAKYFPANQPYYDYQTGTYTSNSNFDTAYRYHAVKALHLFTRHKMLLDSFTYLKNILNEMEIKIKQSNITLNIQKNNLPNTAFLAELNFKNVDTLFYTIVRPHVGYNFSFGRRNEFINDLLKQTQIRKEQVILPALDDLNNHNTYLTIEELPVGNYAMVFSNKPLTDTAVLRRSVYFTVTNIALINNDKRIYILDRKTGKPLAGAVVSAAYTETIKKDSSFVFKEHLQKHTANQKGFVEITNSRYTKIMVSHGMDTLVENVGYQKYEYEDEDLYSKDEYDDLAEYYDDNASAYIYTDRSIYRPGQTVFYKAIFITKNKNTGEPMVMSKKNLKGKLFGSVYKKLLKAEEPTLLVTDPFGKDMDSVKITPDEFGAVYGSFKIPKTAATGEWEIAPDYIDVERNTGNFKVEEYKRPSYEIEIEKPKKELKAGDSILAKVKVRSFAGATLNNVKINYTVTRKSEFNENELGTRRFVYDNTSNETIIDSTGFTNNTGELEIIITDTAIIKKANAAKNDWRINYDIDAEAIDATGESYDKTENISLTAKPVSIRLPMDSKYDRNELKPIPVSAMDRNAGEVNKNIAIKIFRIIKDTRLYNNRKYTKADVWLYDKNVLQSKFPFDNLLNVQSTETKELVYEKTINTTNKEKLELSADFLTAGNYILEANCTEREKITGDIVKYFSVLDIKEKKLPQSTWSYNHMPFTSALPGESIKYFYGNTYGETYSVFHAVYLSGKKKTATKYFYQEQLSDKGLQQYNLSIPGNAADQVKLTQLYILNNQLFTHTETIYITKAEFDKPEIIIEKYRKKLTPGSKETFTVSIKTKNENTAAQLMTTMYDASLDKLERHVWEKPDNDPRSRYISLSWTNDINRINKNYDEDYYNRQPSYNYVVKRGKAKPLWWLNPLDYAYAEEDVMGDWNNIPTRVRNFQHDMNPDIRYNGGFDFSVSNKLRSDYKGGEELFVNRTGITLGSSQGLDEVVVIGYGSNSNYALAGSVSGIRIRGTASSGLLAYNQPLIIIDGVIYEGDISAIDAKMITDAVVFKGADASAIYGARAATGVLVLSTKGNIILPKEPEPVIVPRKNFNETAFFFPAIHADRNGFYSFSFTMPETVTEWNWKLLAHTKKAIFAYAERKLNTQLPLMVQPNMPRLLYQGDKIVLQSRITNLDTLNADGKIICKIEDAVTGNDITEQFVTVKQNNFTVAAKANTAAAFTITVPATQLNPVKITITARSQNFADGEEHIIPVLSTKIFVRDNLPFSFSGKKDTTLPLTSLPADATFFGLGLSIQPKPQAALLNSLPALANYPYGCAEQSFNKLLTYTTAYKLIRTDEATQHSFEAAKQFIEKENALTEKLPDELSQETMPWLDLTNKTAVQQKQLFTLLDTAQSYETIQTLLNKIKGLQNADGGLSWFDGGQSSAYISNYVLKGLGKLAADKQLIPGKIFENNEYVKFLSTLVTYCDAHFLWSVKEYPFFNGCHYAYSRSYLMSSHPIKDSALLLIKKMLANEWKNKDRSSLYNQALLIISSFKYAANEQDTLYKNAFAQLESLQQMAIEDEQNGLRWKNLADNDDLTNSAEETIALLAEAFAAGNKNTTVNKGIIKWLLTAKNEHSWRSTKATAAAINLLATENKTVNGETQVLKIAMNKIAMSASNDLLKGNTFNYMATTTMPPAITIEKENNIAANGNVYRYYFTEADNVTQLNKEVQLTKQWYKLNSDKNSWEIIPSNAVLKIADKIKVVITIESSKPLQYVFINDKRAASFEPLNNSSGYEYSDGMGYYQSVRDAGHQFFIDLIPSGKHSISYEMKVAQEGVFSNGIAQLQCMYRPDITAYSNGLKVTCVQ